MLGVWERHPLLALFAGYALVLVALLPPTVYSSDGANMMRVAESLATSGDFDVPCGDQAIPGRGGRCFSTFYPLLSVVAAPLVLAGRAISSPVGVPPEFGGPLVALLVPAFAAAGAATMTAAVAWQFGASRRAGVFAGAAFAFGTEVLTYARTFFAETLASFFVILAVWGVIQTGRKRWWWYVGITLAILAKPQMALVGPAVGSHSRLGRASSGRYGRRGPRRSRAPRCTGCTTGSGSRMRRTSAARTVSLERTSIRRRQLSTRWHCCS